MTTFADVVFHSVEIESTDFKSTDAVTKSYVDVSLTTAINALVDGALPAIDTLREIGLQLAAGSTVADSLVVQITGVQSALDVEIANRASATTARDVIIDGHRLQDQTEYRALSDAQDVARTTALQTVNAAVLAETSRALDAETLLYGRITDNYNASVYGLTDLDTRLLAEQAARIARDESLNTNTETHHERMVVEENTRLADDQYLGSRIDINTASIQEEQGDRATADGALGSRIDDEQLARQTQFGDLASSKFDSSDQYSKREDGALQVTYLYISDVWRLGASTAVGSKRLQFEFYDGVNWSVCVPFVRPVV